MNGDIWTIIATIFTVVGAIATVISTVIAVRARNEAKDILKQIKEEKSRNIRNSGDIKIKGVTNNSGVISGINSGEIHK